MASIKKELKGLMSRFDAAQEAFAANSTDLKKLAKSHKKAIKALKSDLHAAQVEIEALKAELAISKLSAPIEVVSEASVPRKRTARGARKATARKPRQKSTTATGPKRKPGRPRTKIKEPVSPLVAIAGVGPALAGKFEEAGVKTPAQFSRLSNAKMAEILQSCGPRYRNATPEKMTAYREAAKAVK